MGPFEIKQTDPADIRRVLRLILAAERQTAAELESQVTSFLQYARELKLTPRCWWYLRNGREINACACVESPGRTANLLLMSAANRQYDETAQSKLIEHVVGEEGAHDICLVQCLIGTNDMRNADLLRRRGFIEVAELLYLHWRTPPSIAIQEPVERSLTWVTYDRHTHSAFAQLIADTYAGSLDCPALSGLRRIDDVLEGHKAAGRFLPHRWLMLHYACRPAGCILLLENPLRAVLEIAYMGLHPEFRRRGFGRVLLNRALILAHHERSAGVTLAVDARNEPAMRLYRSAGFQETASRRALVYVITPNSAVSRT